MIHTRGKIKEPLGHVFEAQKFPLRRKEEILKLRERREENLTLKFSIACCVFVVCLEVSYPLLFISEEPTLKRKIILIWSGRQKRQKSY